MSDTLSYLNGSLLASENGHLTKDAKWFARTVAASFASPEQAGNDGDWTAACPLCGGRLLVLVHVSTGTVGVACYGQGCAREEVLEAAGFDPQLPLFYRPETPVTKTPIQVLEAIGDTAENRIETLATFFPPDQNDPLWHNLEWQAFLKFCADDPVLYSELIKRMAGQYWPKEARSNYLAGIGISDPLLSATPLSESKTPILTRMSDVEAKSLSWLWWPLLPLGMVSLLDGDPGLGKSLLTIQLAASLSRGWPLPDQQGKLTLPTRPSTVLFLAAEDSLAHTIRPRLDHANADTTRIHVLSGFIGKEDEERAFTFQHMEVLCRAMADLRPQLVVVDPLQNYLAGIDLHRSNETVCFRQAGLTCKN